uniref:Uncharacterized protein n=1 Tax=viral metagenome TaxID=1070528 RepID=A0A6C0C169_9ZZZZ
MSAVKRVFDNEYLMRHIFTFYPKRCGSCKVVMHRKFVDSKIHKHRDQIWRSTENEYCRGYCNWCCVYNFNHPY